MSSFPDGEYRFSWPYILERPDDDRCLYIGSDNTAYKTVLSTVFSSVDTRRPERLQDLDESLHSEKYDLVILNNVPTVNDQVIDSALALTRPGGRVAIKLDFLSRMGPLTNLIGLDPGSSRTSRLDTIRTLLGVQNRNQPTSRYGVITSLERETSFIADLDSLEATGWVIGQGDRPGANQLIQQLARIAKAISRIGILDYAYPSYVFVYGSDSCEDNRFDYQKSTVNKSTLVGFDEGSVADIRKIATDDQPDFLQREVEVMEAVRSSLPEELRSTVPETDTHSQDRRSVVQETPMRGKPISTYYDREPDAVNAAMEIPFNWLGDVLSRAVTDQRTVDQDTFERMLTHEELGYEETWTLPESFTLPTTPAHGDFFGPNIFTDGTQVTGVIDWEWGTTDGNPVIDAAFYIVQLSARLFGSIEDGIREVFLKHQDISRSVYKLVDEFCETVGISRQGFVALLPHAFLRRAELQQQAYGTHERDWVAKARRIASYRTEICDLYE